VIAAVAHEEFMNMDLNAVKEMLNDNPVLIDVTGMFEEEGAKCEGFYYKRL
jgi:UDP-N-acetyl-D-galactosamine dehydrogenase